MGETTPLTHLFSTIDSIEVYKYNTSIDRDDTTY